MSAKAIGILIKIGIILAFISVPIGSYFLVKRANDKVASLEVSLQKEKKEKEGYRSRLEYQLEQQEISKTIDTQRVIDFDALDVGEIDISRIISEDTENKPSSEVLKKTVQKLKELTK